MSDVADLSVVMPTFKHAQFLPRALDALLSQSVRARELIVVNDASPDETQEILDRYAANDATLQVIRNETNQGVTKCIEIGIARARGKYLYCAASDDYVLPGFIEKTVGALESHPQAGLCSSYFSIRDGITGEIRVNPSGWCESPRYFTPREVEPLIGHSSIPGHATIIKRASFDAAGGLLADLEWHSDWFLNFVVAFREGMCHVPEMLSLITDMPSTYSNQGVRTERQLRVINAIFDRLASHEYVDVAPSFERSGALSVLGTPVIVAAAGRADAWRPGTLKLLNSFTAEQYDSLLDHARPEVRELAAFFLGAYWHETKQNLDERSRQMAAAQQQAAQARERLASVEQELATANARRCEMETELGRARWLIAEREAQVRQLEAFAQHQAETIRRMEASYFWKSRKLLAGCKHKVLKPLGRIARRAACW